MRAIYYEATGPAADVLKGVEFPDPVASAGEVLVRVATSGINPADVKRRVGWGGMTMAHPRIIPHCDGAGVIQAVGSGVSPARVGERIWMWNAQGGYGEAGRAFGTAAEMIALPSVQAVPLPDSYSLEAGACLGVPAMTAHRCIMADGPVVGQTVLVQGGAGAVGYLSVQIALLEGARVITTVSGRNAAERMRALGAEPVDRKAGDVADLVLTMNDGKAVDRIVEVDFAANRVTDARLISLNGTIASYSSSSDPSPQLAYYDFASKGINLRFIQGFALSPKARAEGEAWIAAHPLNIPIAATFPLEQCADAHEHVERSSTFGQTLLSI